MSLLSNGQQAVVVNGSRSSWMPVTSGGPQGSVIGPALFLLYINDITANIQSKMRLFADDSVIYREIHTENDISILQQDLQTLSGWSVKWLVAFNVKKCASLTITRKGTPIQHNYKLSNETIPRADKYKYLGVTITKDLRWNTHCQLILNKANKTLGLLRRTQSPCSKEVKSKAYMSLVRSQLEYSAEAWNPYTSGAAEGLERVQKTAARFVNRDYRRSTSASGLVSHLGWDQLHIRRLLAQSTMLYRIHHHLVNSCLPHVITQAPYISRRDHNLNSLFLRQQSTHTSSPSILGQFASGISYQPLQLLPQQSLLSRRPPFLSSEG